MDNNQLEGVAGALTTALAEFLQDKDFHTELLSFKLAAPEKKKAEIAHGAHPIGQTALDCHFNDQGQYVCTKPN